MKDYLMNYNTETGDIQGFYLKSIHGDNIPYPCIEITEEKHDFYMDNNGLYRLNPITLQDELLPIPEPNPVDIIKSQLDSLDDVLPRCVEDLITTLNIDTTKLPRIMQDRLNQKTSLRNQLKQFL